MKDVSKKRNVFSISGRINRAVFIVYGVFLLVIGMILYQAFLNGLHESLVVIFSVFWLVFLITVSTKRFHDFGWSGMSSLLLFVPILNLIITAILMFEPGDEKENEYGTVDQRGIQDFLSGKDTSN